MRVLFCTTGGLGHVLPLRPLAEAMRARGHEVAWVTAPDALSALEGLGFDLFASGPTFEASRREFREAYPEAAQLAGEPLSAFTFPRLFGAVLAPAMLGGLDHAVACWRPEFVVHEPAALAAPLICRQHGLRHVLHGYGLRPPIEYIMTAMTFFAPHWRARGLEAPSDGDLYGHHCLDIAPESLQPATGHEGDGVFRFSPYRPAGAASAGLPANLEVLSDQTAAARPRIYVTFGTVFNRSPALLAVARAAAQLGGTVVVTVGADGDPHSLVEFGAHVHVHRFVDHAALLPHCDVVASHGGAGTVLGAAAHGVPQLVLPQAADHFRNARALCAADAGLALGPERQDVDAIASALSGMLDHGACVSGARKLAQEMAAMPDAAEAARCLERWRTGACA